VALENWLVIARQTQRDDAWQAVLRIAPGQFDDQALVLALRYSLRRDPSDAELMQDLVEAYERLGEPQAAMAYLQEHGKGIAAREQMALLAERMGEPQAALALWREVLATPDAVTPQRAMHAAVLALVLRQPEQGLAWLEAARGKPIAPAMTADFWRMTGQLAESRQRQELAIEAYRTLAAAPDASADDFDALVRLLAQDHPLEAARVNEMAWRRLGTPGYLVEALTFHVGRSRWADVGLLLRESATPGGRPAAASAAPLLQMPEFLRLAGTYHQNTGEIAKARAYFESGLRVAPESADMRSALLWLFISCWASTNPHGPGTPASMTRWPPLTRPCRCRRLRSTATSRRA
jgi:tetratricopeptide (TPR) repeat protein